MARRRKRSHGGGNVVAPTVAGGPWAIRWREEGKRKFRSGFQDRAEAEAVLTALAGEAVQGRALIPQEDKGAQTLAVLAVDFLEARDLTHRAASMDRSRWNKHLGPFFGPFKPNDVKPGHVKKYVQQKLAEGLNPSTIRIHVALLSSFYTELMEAEPPQASLNPAKGLPTATMRLMKATHDPRTTPFIKKLDDVQRVYADLPEPFNVAFAIGALAGLRTGEVFGLDWSHVDLEARRIHVRQQLGTRKGESFKGLKDKDSRVVPILDALEPILKAHKLKTGGKGLVIQSLRSDGHHVNKKTPGPILAATLLKLGLQEEGLGWYECTRHTFASQWVLNGGSIETLKEVLGHYSVVMTERYAHHRPELFTPKDLGTIPLSLRGPNDAKPVVLPVANRPVGQSLGRVERSKARKAAK